MNDNPFLVIPKGLLAWRGFLALALFFLGGLVTVHIYDMQAPLSRATSLYSIEALQGVAPSDFLRIEKTSLLLGVALVARCSPGVPVSVFEGDRCRELRREWEESLIWSLGTPLIYLFLVLTLSGSAVNDYRRFRRAVRKSRPLGTGKIQKISDEQGFWTWRHAVVAYDVKMDSGGVARAYLPMKYSAKKEPLKWGDPVVLFPIPGRTPPVNDAPGGEPPQTPVILEGVAKYYAPHISFR